MNKYNVASIVTAALLIFAPAASQAQLSLPVYEPFAYEPGTTSALVTLAPTTWTLTGANALLTATVVSGSLPYSGLPAGTGNKVSLLNGANFDDPGMDIVPASGDGTSVYVSFILNVVNPGNTTGDYFLHVSSQGPTSTDFHSRFWIRQASSASVFNVGTRNHTTAAGQVWGTTEYSVGTPLFVVVSYDFVSGTVNDTTRVWINPALGLGTPPSPTLTATAVAGDTDLASVGRINLRQGSGNTNLSVQVDEIRVSTNWTDVTPTNASVRDWTIY
mgnify:CR=1 FL=1